jgi:predicted nucleotide-binding protein
MEEHSPHAGYAIILLTGDDRGGPKDASIDSYKFRARQNVIMELGWFMKGLGRPNVSIVAEPNVEIPQMCAASSTSTVTMVIGK